jgi:hypothetical protein
LTWGLSFIDNTCQGRIQDFKLGGAHLKKLRRAEGGGKILGVFRVKNHDFTPKNHVFHNFRGARAGCAHPPWIRPCLLFTLFVLIFAWFAKSIDG